MEIRTAVSTSPMSQPSPNVYEARTNPRSPQGRHGRVYLALSSPPYGGGRYLAASSVPTRLVPCPGGPPARLTPPSDATRRLRLWRPGDVAGTLRGPEFEEPAAPVLEGESCTFCFGRTARVRKGETRRAIAGAVSWLSGLFLFSGRGRRGSGRRRHVSASAGSGWDSGGPALDPLAKVPRAVRNDRLSLSRATNDIGEIGE